MVFENFIIFMNKILLFSSFINNAQGFPKPLTEEEEKEYFLKYKNGDESAKDKLINHNLRLVAHIVKKYDHDKEEMDDLISIGTIGLIKGVDSYLYSKGTRLTTYCARCIENAHLTLRNILQYFKQHLMLYKVKFKQNTRFNLQILVEHYLK